MTTNSTLIARVGPMAASSPKNSTYISALVTKPSTRSHRKSVIPGTVGSGTNRISGSVITPPHRNDPMVTTQGSVLRNLVLT